MLVLFNVLRGVMKYCCSALFMLVCTAKLHCVKNSASVFKKEIVF